MLEWINAGILSVMDLLLGWVLHLPADLMLLVVAVGTGGLLTLVRPFTANQDLLRRCSADRKRLKQLIRIAKRAKDTEALKRHRATLRMVAAKAAGCEWRPLLAVILPLVFLGTWAWQRIAYVPPAPDEPVQVRLYLPLSAADRIVHMVPMEGTDAAGGWIQRVSVVREGGPPHGLASWTLRLNAREEPYDLQFRLQRKTFHKLLLVGRKTYAPPLEFYDDPDVICSEVAMDEVKLLGVVPGIPPLGIQPWLVSYFLIAIPSVVILKWIVKIY